MSIAENFAAVEARIAAACTAAGRARGSVRLLAVSKGQSGAAIAAMAGLGQQRFGENYVQEALPKIAALPALEWHHIGPIQSNKTADIAAHFAWAQGVDRIKIAERLSAQRAPELPPLQVCVQVNVSGEASKSGCAPEEALALCRAVAALPRLRLRGLMTLPEADDPHPAFVALRRLFEQAAAELPRLDTLSMGMSDDLEAAIAEGSTLVRVGTALFGARRTGN